MLAASAQPAAESKQGSPHLKLNYGNVAWWRAEMSRVALHIGGIDFEDVRWHPYFGPAMTAAAKAAGTGHAPWLEVGDNMVLFQAPAIARYCSDLAGLTPKDPFLAAKVEEVVLSVDDFQAAFMPTVFEGDGGGPATTAFREEHFPKWMSFFEKLLAENNKDNVEGACFFVGSNVTTADIAVWRFLDQLDCSVMGGGRLVEVFDGTLQTQYPLLSALYDVMWAHPRIKAYMDTQYPVGKGVNPINPASPVFKLYPESSGKWLALDHDRREPKPAAVAFWAEREATHALS